MKSFGFMIFFGVFQGACMEVIECIKPEPRVEPNPAMCDEAAQYEASALLGAGEEAFQTVEPMDIMNPVLGPQGGHHFYAGVKVTGLNPGVRVPGEPLGCPVSVYDAVRAEYTHSFPEDRVPPVSTTVLRWMEGTSSESTFFSDYVYIDLPLLQSEYAEESELEVQASVVVTDKCGTTVEDSGTLRLSLTDIVVQE